MSKKASPALIGVFVLVAIAIAAGGMVILGSGKLFTKTAQFVLFFDQDSNLSGLDVGAPVDFKGVRIGQVSDLSMIFDHADNSITIPVIIELDQSSFTEINVEKDQTSKMHVLIDQGLRAQLQSQSMVTGKLKIQLGYHEDSPKVMRGKDQKLMEIPTVPGTLESLTNRIEALPLEQIVLDISESTKALAEISKSGKLNGIAENLREATETFAQVAKKIDKLPLERIVGDVGDSTKAFAEIAKSGTLEASMDDLQKTLKGLSEMTNSQDVKNTVTSLNSVLQESERLLEDIGKGAAPVRKELLLVLDTFGEAARSLRYFTDYLERHPEALIYGKGEE